MRCDNAESTYGPAVSLVHRLRKIHDNWLT